MMSQSSEKPSESRGPDLSGKQLGDFRLLRRLGRGAMAEVYLAEQLSLQRQVAFKVLKPELAADQTNVNRFRREAQAAAKLGHANIVQIYEVGNIDGVNFIAQEYVQGVNLRQRVNRDGSLDLRIALVIMWQVAAALAKAAEQGIVHRDIKPENIMITRGGEVKVADFGLARLLNVGGGNDLTQVGVTMGTPLYMSPEQVEGKSLDPRSDIYSFGVTCYHVLAGHPPFESETALGVAMQHLQKQPESLETVRPDLPPGLARVVHKMLEKKPENRYQSARELMRDLRELQVQHMADDWPEDLAGWETEILAAESTRQDLRDRLDSAMKEESRFSPGAARRAALVAGLVLAVAVGSLLAFASSREPSLLASDNEKFPKAGSVTEQWLQASRVGSEAAWLSIERHWPNETYWVTWARRNLAKLYIANEQYDKAEPILDEFIHTGWGPSEAFGLVGKCWIHLARDEVDDAKAVWARLKGLQSELGGDSDVISLLNMSQDRLDVDDEFSQWLEEEQARLQAEDEELGNREEGPPDRLTPDGADDKT